MYGITTIIMAAKIVLAVIVTMTMHILTRFIVQQVTLGRS